MIDRSSIEATANRLTSLVAVSSFRAIESVHLRADGETCCRDLRCLLKAQERVSVCAHERAKSTALGRAYRPCSCLFDLLRPLNAFQIRVSLESARVAYNYYAQCREKV